MELPENNPQNTAPGGAGERLLDGDLVRTLEHLSLVSRSRLAGRMAGDRKSPRKGAGIEFADFREYSPGDDLRRVDWNLYARSEKLFLKLFSMDEDRNVTILIDCSRSMSFGSPPKDLYARRFAAALAYLGLVAMDRVKLVAMADGDIRSLGPLRGRAQFRRVLEWLGTLRSDGGPGLHESTQRFLAAERSPGLALLLSDFLEPGPESALRGFAARGFETHVFQVLSPEDVSPTLAGDLRLVDSESGHSLEVTVSAGLIARYTRALSALQAAIASECVRCGMGFLEVRTDTPVSDLFARVLPARGVVG